MTRNVGTIDRTLRSLLGLALLAWAITGWPATGMNWLGFMGIVPLLTAVFRVCPAYSLIGVNTCGTGPTKG
jgi:hypothetical protein